MKRTASLRKSPNSRKRLKADRLNTPIVDRDAPQWTSEMFARGIVRKGLQIAPPKSLLSLRIDADVIAWFKAQGPGYQSRMNALLRAYMEAHRSRLKPRA
jgi:uncharacterized protein (DUF4415 family)